jgi:ubiquinone/menaquinone biosynthesis C-methylase UbiE
MRAVKAPLSSKQGGREISNGRTKDQRPKTKIGLSSFVLGLFLQAISHRPSFSERVRARLLRFAFEQLYTNFAWAYDWVSRTFFLGQWRVWQRATLRFIEGERVLEVGMGTGDLQLDLLRAGYEAYGVDLSPQMLRRALRKARGLGVQLRACRASASALPFPDAWFDSVVSTFPSDYIGHTETLLEIGRVLRPGGRLVVVPGGKLKPRGARGKAFEGVARLVYGYKSDTPEVELADPTQMGAVWSHWIAALKVRAAEAGFSLAAHIGSNERGSVLVIVATKQ